MGMPASSAEKEGLRREGRFMPGVEGGLSVGLMIPAGRDKLGEAGGLNGAPNGGREMPGLANPGLAMLAGLPPLPPLDKPGLARPGLPNEALGWLHLSLPAGLSRPSV